MFLQTIYHPLRLYAEHMQDEVLDAFVESPTMDAPGASGEDRDRTWNVADLGPFGLLDVAATCSGPEVCLTVVNRSRDQPIAASIEIVGSSIQGPLTAYIVDGPDVSAQNSFEGPDVVSVREQTVGSGTVEFGPHSVTVMRGRLA